MKRHRGGVDYAATMYAPFFGLKQEPFSIAPDPRYLFMSERHREALAHLLYGLGGGGGFVLLSGEIGAGKTTVCRCFLEQIPRRCNVAYIFNPKLTVEELLKSICDEFHIPVQHQGDGAPTVKDYLDPLNEFLLRTHAVGQNNVLIIDEAQNLSADVLEQLRLLTNLETNERKLLQIVLIGQPELRTMLARPELEQLAQRVIARFHLEALSAAETAQYVRHRLAVAGMTTAIPFDRRALSRIHRLSRGVPRRINLLCDRALLGAYAEGKTSVARRIVDKAAHEVFDDQPAAAPPARRRAALAALGLAGGAALFGVVTLAMDGSRLRPEPVKTAAAPAALPASAPASATAASAPVPPPAPLVLTRADLKTRFGTPTRHEREAWRELGSEWNLVLPDGEPCQAAQRQQVHCFKNASSSLALIRQLGRPGIVTLHDDEDQPLYALLTGLGEQGATLRIGGVSHTVSLASLAEIWRGDFSTFWRAPPGYLKKAGDGESLAEWLAGRLATLQGTTPEIQVLKPRVQAFQLAQGLQADGVAGPVTLMQLNRATGIDEPRLKSEK
jgi:general secretion pathway protein A